MLMPKRVKYRRQQRGRMKGKATRGNFVAYGEYGLVALEPCWITANQIEAAIVIMNYEGEVKGIAGGIREKTASRSLNRATSSPRGRRAAEGVGPYGVVGSLALLRQAKRHPAALAGCLF